MPNFTETEGENYSENTPSPIITGFSIDDIERAYRLMARNELANRWAGASPRGQYIVARNRDAEQSKLRSQKIKYLNEISFETAKKEHGFILDDVAWNEELENKYYIHYNKAFTDTARFVMEKVNKFENGKLVGKIVPFSDEVSFEDFKKSLKLAYLVSNHIEGESYENENTLTLSYLGANYPKPNFRITGLAKSPEGYFFCENTSATVGSLLFKPLHNISTIKMVSCTISRNGEILVETVTRLDAPIREIPSLNLNRTFKEIINNHYIQRRNLITQTEVRHRKPKVFSKKHRSIRRGIYLSHDIPFSAEIETYGKSQESVAQTALKIHSDIGLAHDGSLSSGLGYPIEIQTPILQGKRGEILIAELCNTLIENHFRVDKTCGLHIHLDGAAFNLPKHHLEQNLRPTALINLYLAYRLFDPVIISMLPSTRRANQYCLSFDDISVRERPVQFNVLNESFKLMERVNNIIDFEHYWYKTGGNYDHVIRAKKTHYTWARYFGINFHSLLKDQHLEIRYHSGTLNYEKILYWVDLHGKMIEKCINGEITTEILKKIMEERLSIEQLTERMFSLLNLKEDTVEYLQERQAKFKGTVATEEILLNKTKKVNNE